MLCEQKLLLIYIFVQVIIHNLLCISGLLII